MKAANRYGVTPLSLACTNGNGAMVELLLKAGADPNTALPGGETALMTAARTGKVEAVKALLVARRRRQRQGEQSQADRPDVGRRRRQCRSRAKRCIQAGADYRERLDSGFDAFLFAVREGRTNVVRALLKAGADVNDAIPLHAAGRRRSAARRAPRRHQRAPSGGRQCPLRTRRRSCSMPAPIPTPTGPG